MAELSTRLKWLVPVMLAALAGIAVTWNHDLRAAHSLLLAVSGPRLVGTATGPDPSMPVASSVIPSATPLRDAAWPAPGWMPYHKGPLTIPVAPNPTFTAGSADVINAMWSGRSSDPGRLEVSAGPPPPDSHDFSQPLYFGHASDPMYTISCSEYGGACSAAGATVHIPKNAFPAGGSDHHIAIRDVVTGNDIMLWLAPVPNNVGGAYSVGWGALIASDSAGINAVGASASGLSALWALRETDLAHNSVNHALIVAVNGESPDGFVYPAVGWDNRYFHSNPWPKIGAHLWLDVSPPYAADCPLYAVSYLTALNKYGAYVADNGDISSPINVSVESDLNYTYSGGSSVWGSFAQSLGGNTAGHSNLQISSCGINMQAHMHVLNPPSRSQ